ncbi:pro-pol protein [Moniliophthora roreri MCA 2997]|uniref:Pro-pol protein n=1 Tax=Moniliophthora roreri (strain MCA 2997) TaxID=1381753 RepID=V2XUX3_MONRO|nr:pro-pol protein [Moniliophthora roreri MCA 2997]
MHIYSDFNVGTETIRIKALIDSRAGGKFMSWEMALKLGLLQNKLLSPIQVFNVDGTPNKTAWITHLVIASYHIGQKRIMDEFLLSGLGREEIILGLPWLWKYNLLVDWISGEVMFRPQRYITIPRFTSILDWEAPEELI